MTELHVHLPDHVAERLATAAAQRGVSTEDVAAEVLTQHAPPDEPPGRPFAFIGIAAARPGAQSAADAEWMLEDGLDAGFAR